MLAGGGFLIYVKDGFTQFCPGPYLASYHKTIGTIIMFTCYFTFYKASTSDPGFIKDSPKYSEKYDEIMYTSGNQCKTCKIIKPARSKHCKFCDKCIERFDHHCVWINNCVGVKNHKWFLAFLCSHILITFYGAVAGTLIFLGERDLRKNTIYISK